MDFFPFSSPPADAPERVRIKICGITNATDGALAIAAGADAIGLNFHPGSPRRLDLAQDVDWVRVLAGMISRVGVFVNPTRQEIDGLRTAGLIDAGQLHGDETPEFCRELAAANFPFAKGLRVRDDADLADPDRFGTCWLLLDAFHPGAYGGTGQTLDWALARRFVEESTKNGRRVILSGGLTPENVAAAVRQVRPYGVDVASGVEVRGQPRRKDAGRLRDFCAAVRGAFTEKNDV